VKIRVRGIYSTALSKLFINEGFTIVQPSKVIKDRLKIGDEMDFMPYDVDIFDRKDKHGIYVLASNENLKIITDIIHRNLFDAIIRILPYDINGIYKGVVVAVDRIKNVAFISIKPGVIGILSLPRGTSINIGDELLVQVDKRSLGLKFPRLTTRIGLAGRFIVLFRGDGLKFSKRLSGRVVDDMGISEALREFLPKGFGVVFRSSFKSASREEVLNEASNLLLEYSRLMDSFEKSPPKRLLLNGFSLANVEFPYNSKRILDSIRSLVTSTMDFHHYFKVLGGEFSSMVDNVENLLSKGLNVDEIICDLNLKRKKFIESIEFIEHVKLDGKIILFKNIESIDLDDESITIHRRVKSPGFYDGLNVAKRIGDKIVTKIGFGDWYYVSRYYSVDGRFLGSYININTPIEVYNDRLRYVDLEVDLCIKPDGEIKVLDMDRLYKALKASIISESLFRFVSTLIDRIKSKVVSGEFNDA